MRFGFVGSFGSVDQVLEMAVEAERHGWDGFFTWDGVDVGMPSWDPWAVLAAAAVRTERIRLGALVFALPRRRPWIVAKQAVTVDHLSGGRLVVPVGLGVPEDRALAGVAGEPTDRRTLAALLDDDLAILDLAFRGEEIGYQGTHHTVTGMRLNPLPVQRPRVPLWVVASFPSERSMGRAVRWDGVLPQLRGDRAQEPLGPAELREVVAWVRDHRANDAEPFDVVVQGELADDPAAAADQAGALAEAGATWFVDSRWDPATATPEALLSRVRQGPPTMS
jgi:alkanesulfonate monooxygenase SsuD/methylene tetrahydromethanopterin reductase-like flavin-dependent oxidoreductase (luciferase family)